jgi:hypothetical protein
MRAARAIVSALPALLSESVTTIGGTRDDSARRDEGWV